jgi:K+-sensing histidine kinase KdpD
MLSDDALEELNRLWTVARIFSSTAHDVNNALQVISGSAEMLEAQSGLDEATERRVVAIRRQAARAAEAIDRLLTYARSTGGGVQHVDAAPLVQAAVAMRAFSLNRARVTVEPAWPADESWPVRADPRKALQLLLNVLLEFERVFAATTSARLRIDISREAADIVITATGEGEGESAGAGGTLDAVADAQVAVARRLAEAMEGSLMMTRTGSRSATAAIRLPGSRPPRAD